MRKRAIVAWCAVPLLLTGIAVAAQRQHSTGAASKSVTVYSGEVSPTNADRFVRLVSRHVDSVIGLKLSVVPSSSTDFAQSGYIAEADGPQFVISKSDPQSGGTEVVTNAAIGRDAGNYLLDGLFIVKSGGMHQGISSFGLQPVDEATVRLNPSVTISQQPL